MNDLIVVTVGFLALVVLFFLGVVVDWDKGRDLRDFIKKEQDR